MKTLFSTVLGLGLLASAAAIAAPAPATHDDGHRAHQTSTPAPQQHAQPGKAQPAQQPARPAQHSQAQPARQHAQPASQAYRKGGHLPAGQRGVRMSDWRAKGLRSPGRGQEWRQLDGRYLLIATANGLIVDILSARR